MKEDKTSAEFSGFLVDGMLGSLARKLRILGYDTIYDSKADDARLMEIAAQSKRCLITSDVELYLLSRRRKLASILIVSRNERDCLFEVLSSIGESRIDETRVARCSICNGVLEDSCRKERGNVIYRCVDCGKNYWRGSHWKRLSTLFTEVDRMLRDRKK